jgi:hypothetical protein
MTSETAREQAFEKWAAQRGLDKFYGRGSQLDWRVDRERAQNIWNAAWQAALSTQPTREELTAKLEAEIENRKGWQSRAADAEAKIYYSETPCEGESPDPPINLRERVRELTEALTQTLVIARHALVYFNTESGRAAMEEVEKIEARIKGEQ